MTGENREQKNGEQTANRIRSILAARGLTLHRASRDSELLYGAGSDAFIPHTLYYSISESQEFTPSLAQVFALSRISGYRVEDWVTALGLDLELIGGLQAILPRRRTVLVDPDLDRGDSLVPSLEDRGDFSPHGEVIPVSRLCAVSAAVPLSSFRVSGPNSSLFARIGSEDTFAFPELLPGSIVRASRSAGPTVQTGSEPAILLIESSKGFWCGRFRRLDDGTICALSRELAFAPVFFRTPSEARILGRVDMEIRWTARFEEPRVPREFARTWTPEELRGRGPSSGTLIRRARFCSGLTLRGASLLTRQVSAALGDDRYTIAQSTLSDCEARNILPRHLHKAVTLCLVYGIRLTEMPGAMGLADKQSGQQAIPPELLPRRLSTIRRSAPHEVASGPFRESRLEAEFGEVPWFLRSALADRTGLRRLSLRDFFRVSGDLPFMSPYAKGALVALIDRRRKKPVRDRGLPRWQQPAYVLRLDRGQYLCACCSLDGGILTLHPFVAGDGEPVRIRDGRDAEVVGQIVALARRVS